MGFFTGSAINPVSAPPMFPGEAERFEKMLNNFTFNNNEGWPGFIGADRFLSDRPEVAGIASSLTTPKNARLQGAYQSWAPWDAGTAYLANYLAGGGGKANPALASYGSSVMQYGSPSDWIGQLLNSQVQYGGAGQWPTQGMHSLAQYGVATPSSPGGNALALALQYGAPSQAGQYVSNMAQFGIPSEAGRITHNRATGQPTAATSFLAPFLQRMPAQYNAPSIPTRQLYRNAGAGPMRIAPPVGFNLPTAA